MKPTHLILAAHGSDASPHANRPLHRLAEQLADDPTLGQVMPAFLMGDPAMSTVLDQLPPGDVVVVPVMTSQGYYLRKLPEQFAANANFDPDHFRITPVVGSHPQLPHAICRRIEQHFEDGNIDPSQTTVVVVGHGTRRSTTSGRATRELVATLEQQCADRFPELELVPAFLDQDPEVTLVAQRIVTPHVLVIPFLVSLGPHMTDDVPAAFGLPTGEATPFPRTANTGRLTTTGQPGRCVCLGPLAFYPELAEMVRELSAGEWAAGANS